MDEERKLTPEEIADIVVGAGNTIAKKLDEGSVIVPKLVKAALELYLWLSDAGRIEEDTTRSRDMVAEMYLAEMKKHI